MKQQEKLSIIWFKRDLRLNDNEAIYNALASGNRVLFLYVFEDFLLKDTHYSSRHWDFIKESLVDLNNQLNNFNTQILVVKGVIFDVLSQIQKHYEIINIFSHQETGLMITFDRDKKCKRYCDEHNIRWVENVNNGVVRGLSNREQWFIKWQNYMDAPQYSFNLKSDVLLSSHDVSNLEKCFVSVSLTTSNQRIIQRGGSTIAWRYATSFFDERYENYMFHISKPEAARRSCSRLSPYIAWGNVSIREVYQQAKQVKKRSKSKRHLNAFLSRLRWQAHFIQKFEMECLMEYQSVNKGYHQLLKPRSKKLRNAWEQGQTGFPLIDAAMRCLNTTGYLNFRMRAMLVSFFTHILWQPWQEATHHLAQQFLDFEPGIHFPQIQMQAGETGINNLRIYNPVKNAHEHDPEGVFIRKWVPELAHLPTAFVLEPYLMTPFDQQFNDFILGENYPFPIVDLKVNRKKASDILWNMKKNSLVRKESIRILIKHTLTSKVKMVNVE